MIADYFLLAETNKIHLFDHPKPEGSNYIVLESFSKDKSKTFYVINTLDMKEPVKLVKQTNWKSFCDDIPN